jgi:phage terminase large subunit-like protein
LTIENGKPFVLEPFQETMVRDYFDGTSETLIIVGKKNGKSTLLSALALHHLLVTANAECVIAAASRDQATILYNQAVGFVTRSPMLQSLVDVKRGYREIRSRTDNGRIRVLASDVQTADGVILTACLVDELHRHSSAELYGVFRDGLGPRDGRMVTISTAGDDDSSPLGVMRSNAHALPGAKREGAYTYARSEDGAFVLHEWSLTEEDNLDDMEVVKTANPASWQTPEALARRFNSPSMTKWAWARFACGVWLRGESSAISPAEWDGLCDPGVSIPAGADVYVGLDLGWKRDTTALVPVMFESEDRVVVSDAIVLEPPEDGLLDDRLIVDALVELCERFHVLGVVYDPNAGGQQMVQTLERDHAIRFVEHSQSNAPIALADARFMEAVRRKSVVHDGDPVLRDHVLNAVEKPLGGEKFRFDRAKKGPRKPIDALRALSMAHSVALAASLESDRPRALYSF